MFLPIVDQVKAWDTYSTQKQNITSYELMQRAAAACVAWIERCFPIETSFAVFCGPGNNGGDGWVLAALLQAKGYQVQTFYVGANGQSPDCFLAKSGYFSAGFTAAEIKDQHSMPVLKDCIIVDALFGIGLSRPLEGIFKFIIQQINNVKAAILSIDMPSGLFADRETPADAPVVNASYTLTFEAYKKALLMAENAAFVGHVEIMKIGLEPGFWQEEKTQQFATTRSLAQSLLLSRPAFGHKGSFGHALLIGGSNGKIGAVSLATGSCLQSGVGLCTAYVPECGYSILQTSWPEAMCRTDESDAFIANLDLDTQVYTAIGIGPGMGTAQETRIALVRFLARQTKPLVLDADALNILSLEKIALDNLPAQSIITPHPKEFARLFTCSMNGWEQYEIAREKAVAYNICIVLKGHRTAVFDSEGKIYFNTSGNNALAKGGSGDVLTGLITGLKAQGYTSLDAARLGVWLHGRAADWAIMKIHPAVLLPSKLPKFFTPAFNELKDASQEHRSLSN